MSEVRQPKVVIPPPITAGAVGTPPPTPAASNETVSMVIDGREVRARKGQWIIDAADDVGIYIPRFCYHPRMKPVGMCRMCLVEVSGPRGFSLMPACYNPVADGMEIRTQSEATKKAQDGVLEFLLVNHPLDCPVCDKGGECPLQDQTLAYGPGETRFVEEKRHWDKPIPVSELVYLDRERCIQCGRCVRFADEVAGDPLIDFADRGDRTEVATFPNEPYSSYFSGNVVQICPVGALTAKPYRFRARPWDLEQVESSCTSCSFGCRMAIQSSSDELIRYIGVDSDPVNWAWLCDKGRFGYEAVESPARLNAPLVRRDGQLVEVSWTEALVAAAQGLAAAKARSGGRSLAVIGGARLPNEDVYAWAKTARVALGTDNVDAQLGDGLPAEAVLGLPRATIDQAAAAPLVVTVCGDVKDELPVLYLRLRAAIQDGGLQLVELTSQRGGMSKYAARTLCYRPGELAALVRAIAGHDPISSPVGGVEADAIEEARAHLSRAWEKGRPGSPQIVVVLGRPSLAEPESQVVAAAATLAGLPGVAFLSGLRRSNVHGALDLGLAPGLLPGRVALDDGRAWYEHHWDAELPSERGLDTAGILAAAARGRIEGLVLLGADPLTDFPDSTAAVKGLDGARFVVSVDTHVNPSNRRADVVLPAATYGERRGTFTNLEGRISWLSRLVTAPGMAWPDWMIASELAARLGVDLGWSSLEDIWAEVERLSPLHEGVGYDVLASRQGRDGLVVPVDPTAPLPSRPRPLDPMADPGIASAEVHTTPPTTLMVGGPGVNRVDAPTGRGSEQPDGTGAATPGDDADVPGRPARLGPLAPAATAPDGLTAVEGDELRLVVRRTLWDGGTLVQSSPSLAGLHPRPHAGVHPDDLSRLGIPDGAAVRVVSRRGDLTLPARADPGLAPGAVAVTFNLPRANPSDLIEASAPVTTVRLERVAEEHQSHG